MRTVPARSAWLTLALALLSRADGFRQCEPRTLEVLVDHGTLQHVPRGGFVCRRGEPFEELCLVVSGVLESSLRLESGQRHVVAYSSPGDILGLISCVDRQPVPHDFCAHTELQVLRVPANVFNALRARDASLSHALEIHLAARTRQFYDRLTEALLFPFEARLARMLLELVRKFGVSRADKTLLALRIPQSDLADLLGASRQRVNQGLKHLERQGLLQLRRSAIEGVDVDGLERISDLRAPRQAEDGVKEAQPVRD